ncbi:MAG: RHS domain-containing protein, partial [Actinomycetota bacterium]
GYDGLGRINYQMSLIGLFISRYAYSPGGRLTQITYPNGRTVDYAYDFHISGNPKVGNIIQVTTTANGVPTVLASDIQYHPFGPVKGFSFGNGLSYWMNLDQAYRPGLHSSGPRSKIASYDPAGNLKTLADMNGKVQSFGYDALDELSSAADTQAGSYGSLSYTYIKNGHRKTEVRNGVSTTYSYLGSNRLFYTTARYWSYDAAGNVISDSTLGTLTYDGYGQLATVGATVYDYDALGRRVTKTVNDVTTSFHYAPPGELLYETGKRAYVYLNGMLLARVDNNSVYYYHTDALGAPQLMTDATGTTVWRGRYEPFGSATVNEDPDGNGVVVRNHRRLPGQYYDSETGLYYWGARYYDSKTGRGTSPDRMSVAEHVQ